MILASSLGTMVLAPWSFSMVRKLVSGRDWLGPRSTKSLAAYNAISKDQLHDHVIICGFGEAGHNIARVLKANSIAYVILELSGPRVHEATDLGEPVLFGDCASTHILNVAGIKRARVIVFVISDPFAARVAIRTSRTLNPEIVILTRTKRIADMDELWDQGSTEVIAEEFEASLELMTRVLRVYNAPRSMVAAEIKSIRDQRFGIFRARPTTVPRIRLSSELDIYSETWELPQSCPWHGSAISETRLREETGALILGIIRGIDTINNPPANERIYCGDRLVLSGTKEQLRKAIEMMSRGRH
jgi:CPA2 family monovalent cation:H+ antiporter-2